MNKDRLHRICKKLDPKLIDEGEDVLIKVPKALYINCVGTTIIICILKSHHIETLLVEMMSRTKASPLGVFAVAPMKVPQNSPAVE
ncbi:UDPGT domain-containing protein [Psidium guajava]|nr:UDPGT domain-containing protein [Psidium guajava]